MQSESSEYNPYEILKEKGLLSNTQFEEIQLYKSKGLFSIRNEIRVLLFLSVSLFTGGCGIFIYSHINSVGHLLLLALIILISICLFYLSFKQALGFSNTAQESPNAVHDYLVLAAHLMGGISIGYLQFQFNLFGASNNLATLITTLVYLVGAYYFDNRAVLSLGLTGICAYVGFTASPSSYLNNPFYEENTLAYYGVVLSALFLVWTFYADKQNIKKHFKLTYQTFALHIFFIASLSLLFEESWMSSFLIMLIGVYYFMRLSFKDKATSFLVFSYIYSFIGLSLVLVRLVADDDGLIGLVYISPFYVAFFIFLFVRLLKNSNPPMSAYNTELLNNTLLIQTADKLCHAGFIDKNQNKFIVSKLVFYHYQANSFARIGLFLLGLIMIIACMGFLALMFLNSGENALIAFFCLSSILSYIAIEFVAIKQLKYFGNGLDDAFVFSALLNSVGLVFSLNDSYQNIEFVYFFSFLFGALCAWRYIDSLSLLIACLSLIYFVILFSSHYTYFSFGILPILLISLSVILFLLYRKLNKTSKLKFIYGKCLNVLYFISLALFYTSGNYMAARELGSNSIYFTKESLSEIPVAWLFYTFTVLCPLLYIFFGLKRKNRTLLLTGLGAFVFSIYTIRSYHSMLPIETAFIIGGVGIFGISYYAMKKLKGKKEGLSYEADRFENSENQKALEALAIIESYGLKAGDNKEPTMSGFGGGSSGGAGGGGNF